MTCVRHGRACPTPVLQHRGRRVKTAERGCHRHLALHKQRRRRHCCSKRSALLCSRIATAPLSTAPAAARFARAAEGTCSSTVFARTAAPGEAARTRSKRLGRSTGRGGEQQKKRRDGRTRARHGGEERRGEVDDVRSRCDEERVPKAKGNLDELRLQLEVLSMEAKGQRDELRLAASAMLAVAFGARSVACSHARPEMRGKFIRKLVDGGKATQDGRGWRRAPRVQGRDRPRWCSTCCIRYCADRERVRGSRGTRAAGPAVVTCSCSPVTHCVLYVMYLSATFLRLRAAVLVALNLISKVCTKSRRCETSCTYDWSAPFTTCTESNSRERRTRFTRPAQSIRHLKLRAEKGQLDCQHRVTAAIRTQKTTAHQAHECFRGRFPMSSRACAGDRR